MVRMRYLNLRLPRLHSLPPPHRVYAQVEFGLHRADIAPHQWLSVRFSLILPMDLVNDVQ